MVVLLSNNEFSDAVSGIIERDYFPSQERCDNITTDEKSLTEFHRTTTSATALQLHETLEEKKRSHLHKQSLIYTSNHASVGNASNATAELRNALFFPVSTSVTQVTEGPTTIVSSIPSTMMPPPRKRKPASISLNKKNYDDDCSLTTLNNGNITNIRSNQLINSSATRFPTKSIHSRRRMSSKKRNCYDRNDDADHQHWEGSTKNGEDDDSYFTDLDATTVDSYSIRMELRKAQKVSRQKVAPHAPEGIEFVSNDNILNPLVYQLPRESPRELTASTIIQQRSQVTPAKARQNSSRSTITGPRPSVKSLRSALKESYQKSQGNNSHSNVKF